MLFNLLNDPNLFDTLEKRMQALEIRAAKENTTVEAILEAEAEATKKRISENIAGVIAQNKINHDVEKSDNMEVEIPLICKVTKRRELLPV